MSTATQPADVQDRLANIEKLAGQVLSIHEKAMQPVYSGNRSGLGLGAGNPRNWAAPRDHTEEGRGGFKSFGHFLHDVRASAFNDHAPVLKSWQGMYQKANASGVNESVGSEGGFLVPPQFANELLMRAYDNDLLSRCRAFTTTGNSLSIPAIDETSRANGSRFGGVRAYWESEAASFTASQPAFNKVEMKLKKLIGLCYATEELLQDSGIGIEQVLMQIFAQEIAFKMGDALINGSGAGMPQGVLNAPALVSVSKETGQAAATFLFENLNKMYSRMYAPSRANAVWLDQPGRRAGSGIDGDQRRHRRLARLPAPGRREREALRHPQGPAGHPDGVQCHARHRRRRHLRRPVADAHASQGRDAAGQQHPRQFRDCRGRVPGHLPRGFELLVDFGLDAVPRQQHAESLRGAPESLTHRPTTTPPDTPAAPIKGRR